MDKETENIIEKLAMAITHSEQGEYAKNEIFVRDLLSSHFIDSRILLKKIAKICGPNGIMCSDDCGYKELQDLKGLLNT